MISSSNRRPIAAVFRATGRAAVRGCGRFGISANAVSMLSLLVGLGSGLSFLAVRGLANAPMGVILVAIASGVVLSLLRLWLNMLDGMVAIAAHEAGAPPDPVGVLWNEAPDRGSDLALMIGLAHSGLCHPLLGYIAALVGLAIAYVGVLGQALGAGRRFEGWMSKPWRVVTALLGVALTGVVFTEFVSVGALTDSIRAWSRTMTPLDMALLLVAVGGLDTLVLRLTTITRHLTAQRGPEPMRRSQSNPF